MERGSNRLREAYAARRKNKRRPGSPVKAIVTVTGFNVKKSQSHSPRKPVPTTKKSALRINSSPPRSHQKNYSGLTKNEIQRLINSGSNNTRVLENLWIQKTIEGNSFKNLRKILDSGAIRRANHYKALERAWFNKLIRYGNVNNLNKAMQTNTRYARALENAWSLRRISTANLKRLVNRVPRTTNMGRATVNALRYELNRRGAT